MEYVCGALMSDFSSSISTPTGKPLVAIVILNWNGRKFLEELLPFVLASTYSNIRVVVADNASTDDSVTLLHQRFPSVEIIQNPDNLGFARGYNVALRQVEADFYVLLNSDVEVTPGWLEPLVDLMEGNQHIGACQPKLLDFKQRDVFEYAGAAGGWLDAFGYPFARGRVFQTLEEDKGQYDDAAPCFWASGAALFIRAELFHKVGGLDEFFFAHQEEIDLCWRIQLAGYDVYVEPSSVIYHVGGGTLPQGHHRKAYLNFRNNLIMLAKNLPGSSVWWKLPLRIGLDGVAAAKELVAGNLAGVGAIMKAHVFFVDWLLFRRGLSVFPKDRKAPLKGWYKGLLIWDYFIRRKKMFSDLEGNK